jgi:hypothetical protein
MTIYIDKEFKCHVENDGTMSAVEAPFFDGKCDTFIEGYCYDTSKGYTQIYPWRSSAVLEAAQAQYETDSAVLMAEYQRGVNSAYD